MSHKPGTELHGIRTLEGLRERCHINPTTDCWHWRLGFCDGCPRVWLPPGVAGEKSSKTTGPRAAWILTRGKIPRGRKVYRSCQTIDCVNPEHMRCWTRDEHGAWIRKRGTWQGQPTRIKANRANKRKHAKLSPEIARAIRASTETQTALGARYGVAQSVIWSIKAGRLWREIAPNASVFGVAA